MLLLTITKYLFILALYLFVFIVYRALMLQSLKTAGGRQPVNRGAERRRGEGAPAAVAGRTVMRDVVAPPAESLKPGESVRRALAEEESAVLEPEAGSLPRSQAPPAATPAPAGPEPEARDAMPAFLRRGSAQEPRLRVVASQVPSVPLGEEFHLLAAATIGRDPTNLVVLDDRFVSAHHALIFLKEGRRVLRDRGSTNGTFLNGRQIEEDAWLRNGDRLAIGTTVLEYREPATDAT
jgi:hypothetical protein